MSKVAPGFEASRCTVLTRRPSRVGWTYAALLALAWFSQDVPLGAADSPDLLIQAIETYSTAMEAKDRDARLRGFARSEQLFRQVISQPDTPSSAALWVNLGNAALQAERIGPAIVAFRRALQQDPNSSQARQNLTAARAAVPESWQQDATTGIIDTLFFWNAMYSKAQIRGASGLMFLLGGILLAAGIVRRQPWLRSLASVPILLWLILLGSSELNVGDRDSIADAVVVDSELTVRTADSENAAPRIKAPLPSGVEVKILRERERWTEVKLPGGRVGWVRGSGLETV